MKRKKLIRFVQIFILIVVPFIFLFSETLNKDLTKNITRVQKNLDYVWIMICAALVFFMQAGFMALESGLARAKNSINVSIKNLADFILASVGFWIIGYGIMFGSSYLGLFGTTDFFMEIDGNNWQAAFFVFQAVFVGTAATIDSGAVAERTKFGTYLFLSFVTSILIYPVFGHWAWGGLLNPSNAGWLQKIGFVDFAGSTVVHSIGAWVALAGVIVVGPRIGRFENGKPVKLPPHNLPLVYLGTFILFLGWFGFNAGSTLTATNDVAGIVLNTILSACFGALATTFFSWITGKEKLPEPEMIANGVIGGLVGITAGCAFVETWGAAIIGFISGVIVFYGCRLLEKLKLDDVVGAIPVHGFSGAWGTIATALFMTSKHLLNMGIKRFELFGVQALGVITAFLWAFPFAYIVLKIVNRISPVRVSKEEERLGLNIAEHGAASNLLELVNSIDKVKSITEKPLDKGFSETLKINNPEIGTEIGELTIHFNSMIDILLKYKSNTEIAIKKQKEVLNELAQIRDDEKKLLNNLQENKKIASQELKSYYAHMQQNVNSISKKVQQMDQALIQSTEKAEKMVFSVDNVVSSFDILINSLSGVTKKTYLADQISSEAVEEVRKSLINVNYLENTAQQIRKIIHTVKKITDKTKMLSLNAKIEASRVGEAGRGFGVVAQEIQKLAENSEFSTKEIAEHLFKMEKFIKSTVISIKDISDVIETLNKINSDIALTIKDEVNAEEDQIKKILLEATELVKKVVNSVDSVNQEAKIMGKSIDQNFKDLENMLSHSHFS